MQFEKLSSNITDLPGVEGLCLIDQNGAILFKRMPAFIPDSAYEEAVRRINSLYETIDENFLPADDYVLKFSEKVIILRRIGNLVLLLLNSTSTNLMSLRMVTNLTLKHLQGAPAIIEELRQEMQRKPEPAPEISAPAPAPVSQPAAVPAAPAAQPKVSKPVKIYRGQVIE